MRSGVGLNGGRGLSSVGLAIAAVLCCAVLCCCTDAVPCVCSMDPDAPAPPGGASPAASGSADGDESEDDSEDDGRALVKVDRGSDSDSD